MHKTSIVESASEAPNDRSSVIRLDNLNKIYETRDGGRIQALGPISMEIGEGEFISIVGPSGCGKSTLLRMLAGLMSRTSGDIFIRDKLISGPQKDFGMVFQSPVLLPWKTVIQNVLLPVKILKLNMNDYRKRAEDLLDLVGLGDFREKYPQELSGGMQQRVAIARALVHDPAVLLMDEPFGALDAMTRENMNVELRRIWKESGKTILFVTHSIPEAVFLGTRVLVLSSRPGTIADLIDVDLPTDRTLETMTHDRFGTYTNRVRNQFKAQGAIG